MTRKQALSKAIEALSKEEGYNDVICLLQDIYDELPLIHWSDKSIRDTVEQFAIDNGRNPTSSDFRKKGMPPHPVIKQKYKINLSEWLKINYPTYTPTFEELKNKYTHEFIEEYIRLKPTSEEDFNLRRNKSTKTWITVAKYNGTTSWRELLRTLSLPEYSNRFRSKKRTSFKVHVQTDLDWLT